MDSSQPIRTATWADEPRVGALMALAFASDPFVRWLLPDPLEFITSCQGHAKRSSGPSFDNGTAYMIGEARGASVWLPPNFKIERNRGSSSGEENPAPDFPEEFEELIAKSAAYCPKEPHWYLSFIVVDPAMRGRGYGSDLLRHNLEICDRDGLPAYLESTNGANLSFYKRFGFELLAEVSVGNSPKRYPMLRPPR